MGALEVAEKKIHMSRPGSILHLPRGRGCLILYTVKFAPMVSFKKLFQPRETPDDGLTQTQREAIVDLLNYCSFVDHDIPFSESDVIDCLQYRLHWDVNTDFDFYESKSVTAVREVVELPDAVNGFLQEIRTRLDSEKSREIALRRTRIFTIRIYCITSHSNCCWRTKSSRSTAR